MNIDDIGKYITLFKHDNVNFRISFIQPVFHDTGIINIELANVDGTLEELKEDEKIDIKKLIVERIIELANKRNESISFDFSINDSMIKYEKTKILNKINSGSNYISSHGRFGIATNMIISKDNYEKFGISNMNVEFEILFEDVDDIYLYRKNRIDEPGIIYVYYIDENDVYHYKIQNIGFDPENQFIKIKVN
jgi:hypothetical protein